MTAVVAALLLLLLLLVGSTRLVVVPQSAGGADGAPERKQNWCIDNPGGVVDVAAAIIVLSPTAVC